MPWQPLPGTPADDPAPVGRTVSDLLRLLGSPPPDVLAALVAGWEGVVGPALAERSRPLRVQDGTLLVEVDDPAWATQMRFSAGEILERVASLVGPVATALDVRVARGRRRS